MYRIRATLVACLGLFVAVQGLAASPASAASADTERAGRQHAQTDKAAVITPLAAAQADSLVESYGVGIHLGFLNTPYTNAPQVATALKTLGVRHVRDDLILSDNSPLQYAAISLVAQQAGVKFNLIMGRPDRLGTPADYVRAVATLLPAGTVESLEGVNEWDLFGPQGATNPWVQQMKDWQRDLYTAAKAEPATASLPILSPALAFRANYAKAGDMSQYVDIANAHMYPGGYRPSNEISQITAALRTSIPTKPLVVTEAGYHNATSTTGGHKGVPEAVAGVYAPKLLLEHAKRGERVYSYELLDEAADPNKTNSEAEFGLLHNDFSPKPAYTATKNLLALVNDPGPAFTPTPLGVTADGMPSDARYLLYQKRNGQYVLLLWRDVDIFNPATQQNVTIAPANVTVRLDVPYSMSLYRPSQGATPVSTTVAASLPVSLDGQVTAITIDKAPPPAPTKVKAAPGNKTATVTWELPATSAAVTGFEINRSPGNVTRTVSSTLRSFKDTGLTNKTKYTYKVRTLTSAGASAWATAPTVTPSLLPTAPRIASVRSGPGTATVVWRPAKGRGQKVTGYRLIVGGKKLIVPRGIRRATLKGLPTGQRVRIVLQAHNAIGWSRKSFVYYSYARGAG